MGDEMTLQEALHDLRKKIDGKTSFDGEIEINRQLKGVILN